MSAPIRGKAPDRDRIVPRPAGGDPELRLSLEALRALRGALAEGVGVPFTEELLFRVGRQWGDAEAQGLERPGADVRTVLERGIRRMREMGLASVALESCEHDAEGGDCHLVGRVLDGLELAQQEGGQAPEGPSCSLTVGFLTGLAARATGLDVTCSPFRCGHHCTGLGCPFEIRPAHHRLGEPRGEPAPSGSARFFLGSLGASLGDSDISLDDLIQNTTDAVFFIDSEHVIRFWNAGAEALFQYGSDEAVGRPKDILIPQDLLERGELTEIQERLERDGMVSNHVTRRVRKDGRELWVSLTCSVLHDSEGRPTGSAAVMRDITEQKRREAELARARGLAMIGELAAKVAHEIKNPLTGIYSAIQALGRDIEPADPRRQVFDDVGGEIRRLDDTVQDLLRFARPVTARPHPTGLRSFLQALIEPLLRHPEVARLEIELDVDEDLIVPLDTGLVLPVFTNLLLNAAQALSDTEVGAVRLTAAAGPNEVQIDVADNGSGVPGDMRAAVFDPFFTTKSRGSGLGLSIARRNVECHGGSLDVLEAPEGGACFRVRIPGETLWLNGTPPGDPTHDDTEATRGSGERGAR